MIKKRKHSERSSLRCSNSTISHSSSDDCDPARWWTKQELKEIQESCAFAVKTNDFIHSLYGTATSTATSTATLSMDTTMQEQTQRQPQDQDQDYCDTSADFAELDRFSERNRKRRKLVRWQMYETTKVVQQYARANLTATATTTANTTDNTDTDSTESKVDSGEELLSELLRSYSKPMELDAIESGLRRRHEVLQINNDYNGTDTEEQPLKDNCNHQKGNNYYNCNYVTPEFESKPWTQRSEKQEMGVTMAVARLFLERSLGAETIAAN